MKPVEPVSTVELFPLLSCELLAVLQALGPAEWDLPTICAPWSVKDVAAHLLGGNFGRLWRRVGEPAPPVKPALGYADLLDLINRENAEWVQAARRISPELLIELLDLTDRRLYDHFKGLPQDQPARITVAWAGDSLPPNWFDIAREYTEKWLHQQHIREALGRPLLTGREWLQPVLDTFMRGLPHACRSLDAPDGASLAVTIGGEAGGEWSAVKEGAGWQLYQGLDPQAACRLRIDQDLAWRLFTRGASPAEARRRVQIEGDAALGEALLGMVSIMA